jgi:multicomponent Na+:H+ antiporter subunit D
VISEHFPVLLVLVPLMAAPICMFFRPVQGATWVIATAVSWFCLYVAVSLLLRVLDSGPIVYLLGNWAAPWGIEYRIDYLNAFVLVIVASIGAIVTPYSRASVIREISPRRIYLFYTMLCLNLAGLLGITVTGDAFNLFVFLEISAFSGYTLISLGRDRRALTATYRYVLMGTVGATFYVIGIGMLYMMTGTLNMADLAALIPGVAGTRTVHAALAFLTVGIGLKIAMFPLHMWLPNAYTYAPSTVTAFLASTATKVAVYVLIRMYFTIFAGAEIFEMFPVRETLMVLAVAGMFAGSFVAIFQQNVKRLLAYSSVAQVGYMVLGISFATVTGLTGGMIHLFNHALMKCALFLAVGCVFYRINSVKIDDFAGLGKRMPLTMAAFVVAGLSLIGVPATVGFVSKWYLVLAALEKGWWPIAVLVVVSSLLAIIYIWRVIEMAYFRPVPEGAPAVSEAPLSMLVPTWIMALASVYFGIDATHMVDVAHAAATLLIGGGK